jgi:8-oxo-dGTP pyrophosphatase MutT (NUDIX family)
MTVWIDRPIWARHGTVFAHLVSDTAYEEVHAVAGAAGLPARAFDGDHYDVPERWYAAVLAAGAHATTGADLVRRLNASGLRLRKRRGDKGIRRWVGVDVGEGYAADIDLVASTRLVADRGTGAAATVVRDAGGSFLVVHSIRRSTWDCPGGRREPGESVDDCARRELAEESGLRIAGSALQPCGYERITIADPGHWAAARPLVQVYRTEVPARRPVVTAGDDTDGARWVTATEFRGLCAGLFWWPLAAHLFGLDHAET